MHFTPVIAAAILAATANAKVHKNAPTTSAAVISSSAAPSATWITQTVTEFITDCPTPTSFVHANQTFTVTSSTQVTVPCPHTCTVSWNPAKPSIIPVGVVPPPKFNGTAPWKNSTAPVVPVPTKGSNVPAGNNTAATQGSTNSGSNSGSNSPAGTHTPVTAQNSGNAKTVGTAAVLAGLVGVAAFAL